MITPINKFNFLKNRLHVGDVVDSKIIKKIDSNKAIANIKGYDVIVKSDSVLKENTTLSFFISGFNEKEKTVLIKHLNKSKFDNVKNKIINLDHYIKSYLNTNHLPLSNSTLKIAHFLYLKDGHINKEKLQFILKYLKYFPDIAFIYKLFQYQITDKHILHLLNWFNSLIKKKMLTFGKGKNKSTDNDDRIFNRFVFSSNKEINKKNLKFLFNNKNILSDLLQNKKNENVPFFIYPLMVNSDKELSFMSFLQDKEEYHTSKFNMTFSDEAISFTINFLIDNTKIHYSFIYQFQDKHLMLIIDTNNDDIKKKIQKGAKAFENRLNSILSNKINIIIRDDLYKEIDIKNLDIYI
ncbi:MAG: hypothetical protein KKH98_04240 [Spirochaetes bacterium]|nr:hypothetical protein [Spirochaetota bacterium]